MDCPNCTAKIAEGIPECPKCGIIFAKLKKIQERHRSAAPSTSELATLPPDLRVALGLAIVVALGFTWNFRDYLPIPQGWANVQKLWMPLSVLTFVLHEGGHVVFGLLRIHHLTIAGGTLMELGMPIACLFHFLRQKSMAGVGCMIFWLGTVLIGVAFYAADARLQAIILCTGKSGQEGSPHDWFIMLGDLGIKNYCVGIGRIFFFFGCLLMAFPLFWAAAEAWRRWRA